MAPRPKYTAIAEVLRQRVLRGDYDVSSLPGAPKLASEMGVSYLTVRQAVQVLIEDGLLARNSNGRLRVVNSRHEGDGRLRVTYMSLGRRSPYDIWYNAVLQAVSYYNCVFREVVCSHVDDPLFFEEVDGNFDLLILAGPFYENTLCFEKLKKVKDRTVTMFQDLTKEGIRCFEGPDPASIRLLVSHLYSLGHRRIDCFFSDDLPIRKLQINVWRQALEEFNCTGKLQAHLVNNPFMMNIERAYETTRLLIKSGRFDTTAVFCMVTSEAQGVMRALYEAGIRVPEDVSIVAFGERLLAKMSIPSLTVVCPESPELTAMEIFEHFIKIKEQPEKLMFRTRGAEKIFYGESTAEFSGINKK